MQLTHRFTVPASRDTTWAAFNDIESVAGCFPGAVVTAVEGDDFKGTCKVKLGPIALTYSGSGTFLEKDQSTGRFVLEAKGKDKRGNGTAGATVTASMTEAGPDSTDVEVLTDLAITGKPAQFGRGVIQDVSDKLLGQFMDCLERKLGGPSEEAVAPAGAEAGTDTTDAGEPADTYRRAAPEAGASESLLTDAGVAPEGRPSGIPGDGGDTPLAAASAAAVSGSGRDPGGTAGGPHASFAGAGSAGAGSPTGWTGGHGREAGGEPDDALDLGATVLPILLKTYWRQILGAFVVLLVLRRLLRGKGD